MYDSMQSDIETVNLLFDSPSEPPPLAHGLYIGTYMTEIFSAVAQDSWLGVFTGHNVYYMSNYRVAMYVALDLGKLSY